LARGSESLNRLLRLQGVCIAISAAVSGVFWAIGGQINPLTILLYSLCLGNLITFPLDRLALLYCNRPFPYNWLAFLAVLLLLIPPVFVTTTVIVWWIAPPPSQTLADLITRGWRFPVLITLVYGAIAFFYRSSREGLERRNVELLKSVEQSTARLELQEQELERAREIQVSLLPKEIPKAAGFEIAGAWRPARTVGGDYYDVLKLSGDRLAICIADVVGKGVSAALLMANVQAAVRAFARDAESAARLCGRVNEVLCHNIAAGKFVTFFYGILDPGSRTIQYCNAGHPYPVIASTGGVRELEEGGAVLGVFPKAAYRDATAALSRGDRLVLFTDGISEASRPDGEEFGTGRVAAFAEAHRASSAPALKDRLLSEVTDFCEGQFQDDVTLLVIAVK